MLRHPLLAAHICVAGQGLRAEHASPAAMAPHLAGGLVEKGDYRAGGFHHPEGHAAQSAPPPLHHVQELHLQGLLVGCTPCTAASVRC